MEHMVLSVGLRNLVVTMVHPGTERVAQCLSDS